MGAIAGLVPITLSKAERCWETSLDIPAKRVATDVCSVEVRVLFHPNPDDAQAAGLTALVTAAADGFGQVLSAWGSSSPDDGKTGKRSPRPNGSITAIVILHPHGGTLDWAALNQAVRDEVSATYRRFNLKLTPPDVVGSTAESRAAGRLR